MANHLCDSHGPRAPVVDESGARPLTLEFPTCSVCGVPQVFGTLLSRLDGADLAKARAALPPCHRDSPETMHAGVETEKYGLVIVRFRKFKHAHHKTRLWSWVAEEAKLG